MLFLGVLFLLAGWAVGIQAVAQERTLRPGERLAQLSQPAKNGASSPQPERKIAFEMRDKPWIGEKGSVLEWLSDQTGMPVSTSSAKPTGTLTYINSTVNGVPRQYTLPEVIDILNDELLKQKMILVRRAKTFTIEAADEKLDPSTLPRVAPQELENYGNTELVSVIFPLTALVAEDFAREVDPMLGPLGKAIPLSQANQLMVQDTAANLKRIRAIINENENTERKEGKQWSHKCLYIKARDAEKNLKELLGDPLALLRLMQPPQGGGRGGQFGGGQFSGPFGGQMNPQQAAPAVPKVRMHYISSDESTNTVLVTGPADKIAQAEAIMRQIDVPTQPGQKPILVGPPTFKSYSVPGGNAEVLAKNLQEIYRNAPQVKISAVGPNSILVYAGPGDQFEILEQIQGSKEASSGPEVIPLTTLDANDTVETLKGMFGDSKAGAPFLKADTAKNAIIVKGTPDQMTDVRVAVKALGDGVTPAAGGTVRMINLDRASAATIAEALERMLPQLLQNPVQIIGPGFNENKPQEPRKSEPGQNKSNGQSKLEGSEEQEAPFPHQLVDPQQQQPAKNNQPNGKGAPIKITAVGNRLIISSDDPKALATAYDLVRLLTQPQQGQGDYETIKLKNASATEAAKALDEAFNGPKQTAAQQQGGGGRGGGRGGFGGFFGPFAAPGATTPATPAADTIRVVAYPPTNTLLVRASPLDMLRIRQLLKNAIDTEDTESKGIIKTWILKPLQFANAMEVANIIKDVYREYTNNNPQPTQVGGLPGFAFGGRGGGGRFSNANVDASGNPRGVSLSVGIDDRANRIIVNCTESLYQDIQKLVDQLDSGTKDATRTVKVIPLQGVDPLLVQQAIDAIQGRRTTTPSSTQPSFGPGGFGQSPFGGRGSGFGPSGFGGSMIPGVTPGGRGFGSGMGQTPGGGGTPGGGRSGTGPQSRGPDFFEHRVKDDPQPSLFYDPQQSPTESAQQPASASPIHLASFEQQPQAQPQPQQPTTPPASEPIRGPRSPVTAEALEQLGVIVVSGNNPADVEEVIRIINYIRQLGAGAEVQIQMVPLEYADATSVSNTLTQLFQRVIIGTSGNTSTARPTTTTTPLGPISQQQAASVVLIPLPRFNAILLGAPKARIADMLAEIKRLDRPLTDSSKAVPFALKKASASRVATFLINLYNQRYPNETLAQNQIRITSEDSTNTVWVQAAPADLNEIRRLIDMIDTQVSAAVNELRIVPVKNALASDLATLIVQSISAGIVAPTTTPTTLPGGLPTAPGGLPGLPRTATPGLPGAPGGVPGLPTAAPAIPSVAQSTGTTKTISLRFFSRPGAPGVEAGVLEDIHITPDVRTNSLILAAQSKTMELLLALIRELDVPPPARATVKMFPLRHTDATIMATMLQQLFFGAGTTVGGGAPTALGGAGAAGGTGPLGPTVAGVPTTQFTLQGFVPEGAPLIELRITVDVRTNSLIIAAGPNELDVIDAIIARLEESGPRERISKIIHLRYASAADVANTLQGFLTNALTIVKSSGQNTNFTEFERDVVVFAEPITNQVLVSASPNFMGELLQMIEQLDIEAPQVVIQVLVAEVDLTSTEEFGVEVGLQSPVLFSRSVIPADNFGNFGNGGTVNYMNTGVAGNLVPPGVTVNSSINPAALQGFNFNNASNFSLPLGNNPVVSPGVVGFQGLNNLGVGRANANGIGGFVFSAASNTFNLLIRALKTQGRVDVLSRPQVQTMDNQTAYVNIGEDVPVITGSAITATGLVSNTITYRSVGVILQVTPRISPDGTILMRVIPEVSSVLPTQVSFGNGVTASAFNVQHFETTVSARDGETVAIGGLIQKRDAKAENKIPWLGDVPYLGALFRYRTQDKSKMELMVIMTPHIVRCAHDADRILFEESKRMDWVLGDVAKVHGTTGMAPIFAPVPPPGGPMLHEPMMGSPLSELPAPSTLLPSPVPSEPAQQPLPPPRTMPPARPVPAPMPPAPQSQAPVGSTSMASTAALPSSGDSTGTSVSAAQQPSDSGPSTPADPPKEKRGWSLFPWKK